MARPIASEVPPFQAALLLAECDKVCKRLTTHFDNDPAASEPLTALLHTQIKNLAVEVHNLRTRVTRYYIDHHGEFVPTDVAEALVCVKVRLMEVIELVDLSKQEERSGHEGATNALFASKFILNGNGLRETGRALSNQNKFHRIGLELKDIIGKLPHPSKCRPEDAFQQLQPQLIDFYTRLEKQLRPRYVHTYKTRAETPYAIDMTGPAGSGSYSTVQKFKHRRTGEGLAIKTLHNVYSEKDTRQVLREIGILEICDHKNIVQLVEAFTVDEDDQSMHLVIFPWAPCTLTSFVRLNNAKRQNRCPWFEPGTPDSDRVVYRILSELADAVGYLHARSIKHKDLKPENILFYREGTSQVTPMITDFGVSKPYIPGAKTNYKDSTYVYLAPEQHTSKASTLQSDIWQLGCCFAQLLAVAKGGTSTHEQLETSFNRDDPNCSCCIAGEHGLFMKALADICVPGGGAFRKAYAITTGMLDLDPAGRLDIEEVRSALSRLPGLNRA